MEDSKKKSLNLMIQEQMAGMGGLFSLFYLLTCFTLLYLKNLINENKLFDVKVPIKILDAGCGRGFLSYYLSKIMPESEVFAVDCNKQKINLLKANFCSGISNIKPINSRIEDFNSRGRMNVIFAIDVLEHLKDDKIVLQKFFNHLYKGGKLVIHTPNSFFRWPIFKRYFEKFSFPGHVRRGYLKEELTALLEEAGFKINYSRYTYGFWGTLAYEIFLLLGGEAFWLRYKKVSNLRTIFNLAFMPFFLSLYPFILLLFIIDSHKKGLWGNAILIVARR